MEAERNKRKDAHLAWGAFGLACLWLLQLVLVLLLVVVVVVGKSCLRRLVVELSLASD